MTEEKVKKKNHTQFFGFLVQEERIIMEDENLLPKVKMSVMPFAPAASTAFPSSARTVKRAGKSGHPPPPSSSSGNHAARANATVAPHHAHERERDGSGGGGGHHGRGNAANYSGHHGHERERESGGGSSGGYYARGNATVASGNEKEREKDRVSLEASTRERVLVRRREREEEWAVISNVAHEEVG